VHVLGKESDYRACSPSVAPGHSTKHGQKAQQRDDDVGGGGGEMTIGFLQHSTHADGKSTLVSTESGSVGRSKSAWSLRHHHVEKQSPSSGRESLFRGATNEADGEKTPGSTGASPDPDHLAPTKSLQSSRSFTAATSYFAPPSAVAQTQHTLPLPAQERVVNSSRTELGQTPTPDSLKRRLQVSVRSPSVSSTTRALTPAGPQEIFSNINSNAFFIRDDVDEWRRERQIDGGSLSYALLLTSQIATARVDAAAFPNLPIAPKLTSVDPRFSSNMLTRLGEDTIPRLSTEMYWKIYPMYHDDAVGYLEYVERWYDLQDVEERLAKGGTRERSIYTAGDPPQDIFNTSHELVSSPILRSGGKQTKSKEEEIILPWPTTAEGQF
jgi:hypothetical protein